MAEWARKKNLREAGLTLDDLDPKKASDRVSIILDLPQVEQPTLSLIVSLALAEVRSRKSFGQFRNPGLNQPPMLGHVRLVLSIETDADIVFQVFQAAERSLIRLLGKIEGDEVEDKFEGSITDEDMSLGVISGGQ